LEASSRCSHSADEAISFSFGAGRPAIVTITYVRGWKLLACCYRGEAELFPEIHAKCNRAKNHTAPTTPISIQQLLLRGVPQIRSCMKGCKGRMSDTVLEE